MTVQVNYISKFNAKSVKNYALFANEKFQVNNLKKLFSKQQISFISEIIEKKNSKKNFLLFDLNSKQQIIFIKAKKNISTYEMENLGAEFHSFLKANLIKNLILNAETAQYNQNRKDILEEFLFGVKLKSYEFNLYKSKKKTNEIKIDVLSSKKSLKPNNKIKFKSLVEGTNFARDLVSEPPNVLNPKEYVNRLLKLKKLGIKVTIYNESKLKKLKMFALLGVGKGSINESYLVTLEWYGNKKNKSKPLSFVGKGVCFDTGGISLKPAKFMEEMKYDMAGSAVVAGLIKNLAI